MVTRPRLVALLVVLGLAGAGCGIPTQQGPNTILPNQVPFGLLSSEPPSTTTTQPRLSSLVPVKIYLLTRDQQLTAVERYVFSPAPLNSVLAALVSGPTASDSSSGLTSAVPRDVTILGAQLVGSSVTVNLSSSYSSVTGASAEQAA